MSSSLWHFKDTVFWPLALSSYSSEYINFNSNKITNCLSITPVAGLPVPQVQNGFVSNHILFVFFVQSANPKPSSLGDQALLNSSYSIGMTLLLFCNAWLNIAKKLYDHSKNKLHIPNSVFLSVASSYRFRW